MIGTRLVQLAILGPAAAGVLWLVLAPWRWPRRLVAGAVVLASLGAAWWVFWLAYLGERPAWRGLSPSLLEATIVAVAEVGILFALVEAERRASLSPVLMAGLAAAATSVALAGYTGSLVLLAVAVPIPTMALAATAVLNAEGRRGLVELAGADVVAVLGLSVVFERTGTSVIGTSTGLGVGLILAAAAVKAGAFPWLGTARLVAGGGAASPLAAPLRGQGILLAGIAAMAMAGGQEMASAANTAAIVLPLAGLAALLARTSSDLGAAVIAAGAGVVFLDLGLGGGFGARAFLVTFPPFLLASAVVQSAVTGEILVDRQGRWRRVLVATGMLTAGVAIGSLVGAPPGGGFPGTWMGVSLAVARGMETPVLLLVAVGSLLGMALALVGGIRLLRSSRLRGASLALAVPVALALLYAGTQPLRLGVGWWLRIEESLGLPIVLSSAGGPALPPVGGLNLVMAVAPGVLLVLAAVALGRGIRLSPPSVWPAPTAKPAPPAPRADPATADAVPTAPNRRRWSLSFAGLRGRAAGPLGSAGAVLRRPIVGLAVALGLEAVAIGLAVRLLVLAANAGFL